VIYLISGQPGHGKTLRAVQMALEYKAQGRAVYAHGIRGLDYAAAGFFPLDDPKKWEDLPDGSVIVLDECYGVFPRRAPGAKVPGYVDAMARHRHRGFDFILICQQARQQIDLFLLGLVDRHYHVRRKMGMKGALILEWDEFSENTKNSDIKKPWKYPRDLMQRNLYESTTQDTTRVRVPWYIWALPLTLLLLWFLVHRISAWFHPESKLKPIATTPPVGSVPASSLPMISGKGRSRPDDIAAWLKPRIPGQPWTAPAYDDRPIASEPELYCMAIDDGRCGCITEQGTKYELDVKLCRSIARNGTYNPTRAPAGSRDRDDRQGRHQDRSQDVQRPSDSQGGIAATGAGAGWPEGVPPSAYVPPGTPGTWNPHALDGGGSAK
jgi:hypothetical protein